MLITIPDLITKEQAAQARARLSEADWVDGKVTAGYQAQTVKKNFQIPENHPVAKELGEVILAALGHSIVDDHTEIGDEMRHTAHVL